MGLSNASGLADYSSGIGTQGATLKVDATNQRVGIGTTNPQATLQVGTGVTVYGNSGIVSATAFYGDGSNLSNTGSTLSAASGVQRVVVTSQTSGTMTASATDADITFNAGNNTLFVGTASSSFVAPRAIGIGTTNIAGRDAGIGTAIGTIIFNNTADGGTGQLEVYTGKGWVGVTSEKRADNLIEATGGTKTTSGEFTVHTFTTSGSLVVSTSPGSFTADFLVIGGGGGGAGRHAGGGGAGGYRASTPEGPGGPSPVAETALTMSTATYTITVGTGGGGGSGPTGVGARGGPSSIAGPDITTITSEGGGGGANDGDPTTALPGGCGGGGSYDSAGGTGNRNPSNNPVPNQGYPGGGGPYGSPYSGSGGGGAGGAGTSSANAGPGGNGKTSTITGSPVTRAGGGGGGSHWPPSQPGGTGGSGGGGAGGTGHPSSPTNGSPGTDGTGSGGGGSGSNGTSGTGGDGGDGVVIIRYTTIQ